MVNFGNHLVLLFLDHLHDRLGYSLHVLGLHHDHLPDGLHVVNHLDDLYGVLDLLHGDLVFKSLHLWVSNHYYLSFGSVTGVLDNHHRGVIVIVATVRNRLRDVVITDVTEDGSDSLLDFLGAADAATADIVVVVVRHGVKTTITTSFKVGFILGHHMLSFTANCFGC